MMLIAHVVNTGRGEGDAKLLRAGAPEGTRTPDLLLRRQSLYPTELRARYPKLYMPQAVASVGASHRRMSACAIGLGGIQR